MPRIDLASDEFRIEAQPVLVENGLLKFDRFIVKVEDKGEI